MRRVFAAVWVALLPVSTFAAEAVAPPSEHDFLSDIPIVLSVSRLPQPLDEAPGAVTLIDRATIRRSGARTVPDLLRLVPGFQVSNAFEASPPIVAYHGGFGDYSNRLQVLIDGRSAYSSYMLGNAGNGLQTIAVEDIDHIEVLRGSNSATYGARAVLGVINIVTRDPNDTRGVYASVTGGSNGIGDRLVRGGWGNDEASFRITANRSGDLGLVGPLGHFMDPTSNTGLSAPNGANHLNMANFRADFRPTTRDTLELRAGIAAQYSGTGNLFSVGNPVRQRRADTRYLQGDWKRVLSADSDISLSVSRTEEALVDNFAYKLPAPFFGTVVDYGGTASNDAVLLQHIVRLDPSLRLVWGAELRREEVDSAPLYGVPMVTTRFTRLFSNLEWRVAPSLVLNAGALFEQSSLTGNDFSPRLMLNWHLAPGQTLRIGSSHASRPPSMYEKEANTRYTVNNVLISENYVARGGAQPETVRSQEIGYLGEFRPLHLSLDVRAFRERFDNMLNAQLYELPPGTLLLCVLKVAGNKNCFAGDFMNDRTPSTIHGLEYQLKAKPWQGAQLTYNQAFIKIDSNDPATSQSAPNNTRMLMFSQQLPANLDLSMIHYTEGAMSWQKVGNPLLSWQRTDLRLAWQFSLGRTRGELAAVAQNLGGHPYNSYNNHFYFPRQIFTTLNLQL